jgi:hypothetical protein
MARPFPVHPRGPRRAPRPPADLLLACPRVSPEWELSALRALVKPQTKTAIIHRSGAQRWPAEGDVVVQELVRVLGEQLNLRPDVHCPKQGEYFFAARIPALRAMEGRAMALALSTRLPNLWLVYGKLFLHAGKFYRRERGFKLNLVAASNVHLTRALRNMLQALAGSFAEAKRGSP